MANTFQASVVTPERAVLDVDDAVFVALPAHDGEIGIQPGRAPLLTQLGIGVLRIKTPESSYVFFVDRGFAQMAENKLTILTEQAKRPAEIDTEAAQKALEEAQALEIRGGDDYYAAHRLVAIDTAKLQLNVAKRTDG